MTRVPDTIFTQRENNTFIKYGSMEFFKDKRVVVFSLPGAFTPTCSNYQLPSYEEKFDEFTALGIDSIYCISVNDGFVMNAWAETLGIERVKLLADGNGDFTRAMGMQVEKANLGFGYRSWRYAMVVNDGTIEQLFEEPGKIGNADTDPYTTTDPDTLLDYLKTYARKDQQ